MKQSGWKPVTEKEAEKEILESLRDAGLMAFHMDTTINGFPDILAMGSGVALVEMKCHDYSGDKSLNDIMEPSQPVFMDNAARHGFSRTYLCVFDGKSYSLYGTFHILASTMAGRSLGDLVALLVGAGPEDVARFIMEEIK